MRILHLIHRSWPFHGGSERYVLEHASAGRRWGHESVICTTDAWDMSWLTSGNGRNLPRKKDSWKGIEILRFPVVHPPLQNLFRAVLRRLVRCGQDRFFYPNPFIPSMSRYLRRRSDFDFVHANAMPFLLYQGWDYSKRNGTGLVSVPHASVGGKYRSLREISYLSECQRRILCQSSLVVAQSNFEKELFQSEGVPEERILRLGSGVDPMEFKEASRSTGLIRHGLKSPVVLCLTAHSFNRGSRDLIKASVSLLKKGREFTLVLAGPIMPDMESMLNSLSETEDRIWDSIVTTGYVGQEERIDLLAAADIVVQPSRLECFGIVLLEGWISGKPVIGSWTGAMPDLIQDGENGFLVPWGDPVTLADRIDILLENKQLRHSMGENGRREVQAHWTWDRITDRFYRRLSECEVPSL